MCDYFLLLSALLSLKFGGGGEGGGGGGQRAWPSLRANHPDLIIGESVDPPGGGAILDNMTSSSQQLG